MDHLVTRWGVLITGIHHSMPSGSKNTLTVWKVAGGCAKRKGFWGFVWFEGQPEIIHSRSLNGHLQIQRTNRAARMLSKQS